MIPGPKTDMKSYVYGKKKKGKISPLRKQISVPEIGQLI